MVIIIVFLPTTIATKSPKIIPFSISSYSSVLFRSSIWLLLSFSHSFHLFIVLLFILCYIKVGGKKPLSSTHEIIESSLIFCSSNTFSSWTISVWGSSLTCFLSLPTPVLFNQAQCYIHTLLNAELPLAFSSPILASNANVVVICPTTRAPFRATGPFHTCEVPFIFPPSRAFHSRALLVST